MKTIRNPFICRAFLASTLTACISLPTAFAADLTWDNGAMNGNWNTTDANWTSSTWSNANPDNAVFNDRNETVTLTEAITAGSLSFLAGGRQSGNHLLTLTGSSLSLESITVNGIGLGGNVDFLSESANQRLKLNNMIVTASADVSVARGSMELSGTTALNITGKLLATGDWSNFVMGAGTSVTATGGVDFYNSKVATNLDLNGGTLTTAYIYGNSHSGATVNFNGTTVVAMADNADFLQVHQSGSAVTRASARLRSGGLIFDTNGHAVTIANVLADGGGWWDSGSLTKTGTGTLTLSSANTYVGTTTVNGGTLNFSGASALSGAITVASVTGTNATLEIQNGTYALGSNAFKVGDASNATGTVNQSGGAVSFTGGTGLLIGAPSNSYAGSVGIYNLSGGSISAATGNNLGLVLGVNSGLEATFNLSGSGNLTVSSGRLQIGRSDWTSSNTSNLFNQTGGMASISTLTMGGNSGGSAGVASTLTLTGGTFSASSFTILAAGNTNTAVINIGGTADVTLPALPTGRGSGSTATLNFDGGTLRPFAASSNFIGGLTNAFILDGGAKIDVASGNDITITQNLLTDTVSTGGGLTKDGVGMLTLSGTNTYTGATAVSAGKLVVNGNISTSSLTTVAATATLGGTGTIGAASISGILAPGNSIGTITATGDVTWNDNDAWVFELGSAASTQALANSGSSIQDMLNITGIGSDFLKGSGSSFTFDFASSGAVGFYKLVDWAGTSNFSADDFLATNLTSGLTATFTVDGGTSALYLNVVPEPNAAALVGGFGMLALLRRRRS